MDLLQNVQPGKGRVINCLTENMAKANFGEDCKEELQHRVEIMEKDYR